MHGFDYSIPYFLTRIRGIHIAVAPQIVANVLRVPRVEFPDYLVVSLYGLCPKISSNLLSVSALQIGVSVSSLTVRALQKALDFLTWS